MRIVGQHWAMREPFVTARETIVHQQAVTVLLTDSEGRVGRGEACGVDYDGETIESMRAQLEAVRPAIEAGITRVDALSLLPPGGARCSLDVALWDLQSKCTDGGISGILGAPLAAVRTAVTIGIRSLGAYEQTAREHAAFPILKVKVGREAPLAAIAAVRRGAPNSALIVDPNQAWTVSILKGIIGDLQALGVVLVEQPCPVGAEGDLEGWRSPIPLAADELVNDAADLDKAAHRFDVVNIKLDKCGGLTAALLLADAAEERGMQVMAGCMAGSSLAIAPAIVLAQRSAFVDLDGPLLQRDDWSPSLVYEQGWLLPPDPDLWG